MAVDLTTNEMGTARKVAVESMRRYRGHVEQADVEHELLIWMWENDEHVLKWREGSGYKALFRALKHEARRYCEREKAARVGYEPDDNRGYRWQTLREYLPDALKEDWSMVTGVDGEPQAYYAQILIDVRRGLQQITPKQAELLTLAVEFGFDYVWLAHYYTTEERSPSDKNMRDRVDYALKKLAEMLSQPRVEDVNFAYRTVPRYSDANKIRQQLGEAA